MCDASSPRLPSVHENTLFCELHYVVFTSYWKYPNSEGSTHESCHNVGNFNKLVHYNLLLLEIINFRILILHQTTLPLIIFR